MLTRTSSKPWKSAPVLPKQLPTAALPIHHKLRLSPERLKVYLVWLHSFAPPVSRLFSVIVREVCSYIGEEKVLQLPYVKGDALCLFLIEKARWQVYPLKSPVRVSPSSRCLMLDSATAFLCGGESNAHTALHTSVFSPQWKSVYALQKSGQVLCLNDMYYDRGHHGVYRLKDRVMAFGGVGRQSSKRIVRKSCEEFATATGVWSHLPDMSIERHCFNVSQWRRELYLCGGCDTAIIEAFDVIRRKFRVASFKLPREDSALSVCSGEELIAIQSCALTVISAAGKTAATDVAECANGSLYSLTGPVLYEGKAYYIDFEGVVCYDVKKKERKRLENPRIGK